MQPVQPDLMKQKEPMSISINGYELEIIRVAELSEKAIRFSFCFPCNREIYILEGKLSINSEERNISLYKGDICFVAPDVKTKYILDTATKTKFITVSFDIESSPMKYPNKKQQVSAFDIQSRLNIIAENSILIIRNKQELTDIVEQIRAESAENSAERDLIIASLYFRFIVRGLRYVEIKSPSSESPDVEKDFVMELVKYVRDNIHSKMTLNDIARYLHISPRHVDRLIKKNMGMTFHRLLEEIRFFFLEKYLTETDLSMEVIAEKIGYSSPRAAYNLLKKYVISESVCNKFSMSEHVKYQYDMFSVLEGHIEMDF